MAESGVLEHLAAEKEGFRKSSTRVEKWPGVQMTGWLATLPTSTWRASQYCTGNFSDTTEISRWFIKVPTHSPVQIYLREWIQRGAKTELGNLGLRYELPGVCISRQGFLSAPRDAVCK